MSDHLEHYGVKGMKWGKRKADDSGGGKSKPSSQDIKDARERIDKKVAKTEQKNRGIESKVNYDSQASIDKAIREMAKNNNKIFNDPDIVTAARMTKGEKVAAVAFGAPYVAAHRKRYGGTSKSLEKAQKRGDYR